MDKNNEIRRKVVTEYYEKNKDIERHFNRAKTYNRKKVLDKRKNVKEKPNNKCS